MLPAGRKDALRLHRLCLCSRECSNALYQLSDGFSFGSRTLGRTKLTWLYTSKRAARPGSNT